MSTVTGLTAEKINALLSDAVVSVALNSTGALTFTTKGGKTISAGTVSVAKAYPVGSLFFTTSAVNPATSLGFGSWTAWGTGRVPVGVDTTQTSFNGVEKTGGTANVTLTLSQIPSHTHNGGAHTHSTPAHTHAIDHNHASFTTGLGGAHTHTPSFSTATGSSATNIPTGTTTLDRSSNSAFNNTSGADAVHTHDVDVPAFVGNSGSSSGTSGSASANTTSATGGDANDNTASHNNLQPYITCYMWKRTA